MASEEQVDKHGAATAEAIGHSVDSTGVSKPPRN